MKSLADLLEIEIEVVEVEDLAEWQGAQVDIYIQSVIHEWFTAQNHDADHHKPCRDLLADPEERKRASADRMAAWQAYAKCPDAVCGDFSHPDDYPPWDEATYRSLASRLAAILARVTLALMPEVGQDDLKWGGRQGIVYVHHLGLGDDAPFGGEDGPYVTLRVKKSDRAKWEARARDILTQVVAQS